MRSPAPTPWTRIARTVLLLACWTLAPEANAATLSDPAMLAGDVLAILDARLALMPDVAAAKWATGQPVSDPAREAIVIHAAGARAVALGLDAAPVEALFGLQIELARREQEDLLAAWRRAGVGPAGPPPSLTGELRPKIDRQTADLLVALYLAAPSLRDVDLAGLAAARLPAARWHDEDRVRLVAALRAIRLAAARSPARARAAGVLRIGTPGDYAPFALARGGPLEGSDVELAERLAATLGLRPVFVQSRWAALVDDLEADRFDLAVGGISITEARRQHATFSAPVAHGGKTAIGRCGDRGRYARLEDLDQPGVRIIENAGGTNEAFARRRLRQATLRVHPDNRTVMDEIVADRADAMFTDDTEIALVEHQQRGLCRLFAELYDPADKAFLLPHDGQWNDVVGAWLARELAAGTPTRLLEEHLAR